MTIYETYQHGVEQIKLLHKKAMIELDAALQEEQRKCSHRWDTVKPDMFYALGNSAPGKKCLECGLMVRVNLNTPYWEYEDDVICSD